MNAAVIQSVYDFENIIAGAVASVLSSDAIGLNAATQATVNQLQKDRPRVEIIFRTGSEFVPRKIVLVNNIQYNVAWHGTLYLGIITDAVDAQKPLHAQYISMLRAVVPYIGGQVNATDAMVNLDLQFLRESGTNTLIKTDEGFWKTDISFAVDFTLNPNCLQQLLNS